MSHDSTPPPEQPDERPDTDRRPHVDAEWKAEARAEKERLAREAAAREAPPETATGPEASPDAAEAAAAREAGGMPPPSFVGLVQTLATQAIIFLSNEEDPNTGRPLRNLDLAKHNIDLLGVLEKKTAGNLADEEKRFLDRMLYELRMAYVSAAS